LGSVARQSGETTIEYLHVSDFPNKYEVLWSRMLKAMKLKERYIAGDFSILSNDFLNEFYHVETELNNNLEVYILNKSHRDFIKNGCT
jgi:hypothetical protein